MNVKSVHTFYEDNVIINEETGEKLIRCARINFKEFE